MFLKIYMTRIRRMLKIGMDWVTVSYWSLKYIFSKEAFE
jgi:hypothetical protein